MDGPLIREIVKEEEWNEGIREISARSRFCVLFLLPTLMIPNHYLAKQQLNQ
jgi:hypothetical protein